MHADIICFLFHDVYIPLPPSFSWSPFLVLLWRRPVGARAFSADGCCPPHPTHTPSPHGSTFQNNIRFLCVSIARHTAVLFTLARTFPQFKMEKLVRASMNYTIFGLASGVYWRELTKHLKYVSNGTSQLRVMHTHCFALGSFFFLFVLLLEKCFALTKQKNYKKFYITYNIGLGITLMIMMIHGTLTVMGNDQNSRLISWTAGLGHIFLSVGFGYFYNVLLSAVRASGDKAGKKTVTASP
ncbi:hypothetical protein, unknown function [Leishmania infantum JPCM5]|uniref:Uncharacterized protein n=3 Tax=Leishmania donovani species complex TaxID=38574 RepID=A4HWH1_LEIIN|nr:hypothetical protein, unknown function [Leishmania infantum JPCM5]CAM66798.1 hypothetical protein, unknown function [Leishmania infantum JPCM5]|eukprot:XP_001464412.1 hypothetical protein, unknown function [Leishmania infantum JPCM5]